MKTLSLALLIGGLFISSNFGQERTDEKKWTIDPQTGDTIFITSVIVSQSEDITTRNSMIVINPLKFLVFYNISYFQKINDGAAIGVGLQMPTISGVNGFGVWKQDSIPKEIIYEDSTSLRIFHTITSQKREITKMSQSHQPEV